MTISSPFAADVETRTGPEIPPPPAATSPSRARSGKHLALVSFAAVGIFWGTSGPLIRYTSRYIEPLWMVTLRFAIAGALLYAILALLGRRPPLAGLLSVWPSALSLAISNLLVTIGFSRVESGSGTLLLATTAVSFAVVDRLWPGAKSRAGGQVWSGLLLGLLGVAVLVLGENKNPNTHWSGFVLLAISSLTWALGSVAQSRRPSGMDPLQSSAWQMLIAAASVLVVAVTFGRPFPHDVRLEGWLGLMAIILTGSLIGFVGFVHMIRHIPAYVAGSYTYVNAVVAALTGSLWLGEHLGARFYVAALLVLSGVALIQLNERHLAKQSARLMTRT